MTFRSSAELPFEVRTLLTDTASLECNMPVPITITTAAQAVANTHEYAAWCTEAATSGQATVHIRQSEIRIAKVSMSQLMISVTTGTDGIKHQPWQDYPG